jgi:hypothetical protein
MATGLTLELSYDIGPDGKKRLTIPPDQVAAVVAYCKTRGAERADAIAATVQEGHDELMAALAGVSEEQAAWKPAPDAWSILELMQHVVSVKQMMAGLSKTLATGQRPPGAEQFEEPSAQDGVTIVSFSSLAEAITAAEQAHAGLLESIAALDAGEINTDVTFSHFVFGPFNSREWTVFQRVHDQDHTPHIGKIKATAGFPRPWGPPRGR